MIFLAVGVLVGISVPLVLHLSHWIIAVILVSLLVVVTAEGGSQVWHESDQQRKAAQAALAAVRPDDDRDVRNYRTIEIQAGDHTITAADPLPSDLSEALDRVYRHTGAH